MKLKGCGLFQCKRRYARQEDTESVTAHGFSAALVMNGSRSIIRDVLSVHNAGSDINSVHALLGIFAKINVHDCVLVRRQTVFNLRLHWYRLGHK